MKTKRNTMIKYTKGWAAFISYFSFCFLPPVHSDCSFFFFSVELKGMQKRKMNCFLLSLTTFVKPKLYIYVCASVYSVSKKFNSNSLERKNSRLPNKKIEKKKK